MAAFGTSVYANAVHGSKMLEHTCPLANVSRQISGLRASTSSASQFTGQRVTFRAQKCNANRKAATLSVRAVKDGAVLDRPLRVAVIGGGPSGACTAETLAQAGIETYLLERKMDNCKVQYLTVFGCSLATFVIACTSVLVAKQAPRSIRCCSLAVELSLFA